MLWVTYLQLTGLACTGLMALVIQFSFLEILIIKGRDNVKSKRCTLYAFCIVLNGNETMGPSDVKSEKKKGFSFV